MESSGSSRFKICLIQNSLQLQKEATLSLFEEQFLEAVDKTKAKLVFLGECFNSLYHRDHLIKNAEDFNDPEAPTVKLLKRLAYEHDVYIFACIPESNYLSFFIFSCYSYK